MSCALPAAPRPGWPALTGTPREIAWAEAIRRRLVDGQTRAIRSGQGIARATAAQSTRDWLLIHTDARWWIENRDKKPSTVSTARYREVLDVYGSIFGPRKRPTRALLTVLFVISAWCTLPAASAQSRVPLRVKATCQDDSCRAYVDVLRTEIASSSYFRSPSPADLKAAPGPYTFQICAARISQQGVHYEHGEALSVVLTVGGQFWVSRVQLCDDSELHRCAVDILNSTQRDISSAAARYMARATR